MLNPIRCRFFSVASTWRTDCLLFIPIAVVGRSGRRDNQPYGGPGSVVVSEIDLSSPLNYGTPTSHGGLAGVGFGSQGSVRTPGVRGTPIRIRSDIQSEKRLRQVSILKLLLVI